MLVILFFVGSLILILFGWGIFWLLVQLGVIVSEARKPTYIDNSDYTLDQGREVGQEESRN
ncbi:MAG: hypothetical protein MI924_28100 [Chloroflexales bacterium]|nr:hypothetical protein [Chloroflexales bacterium]